MTTATTANTEQFKVAHRAGVNLANIARELERQRNQPMTYERQQSTAELFARIYLASLNEIQKVSPSAYEEIKNRIFSKIDLVKSYFNK